MKRITKNMKIEEVIQINPLAAEILAEEGFHCFGCGGASVESLEEGLSAHGKTEEQIKKIIKKLNN
ncbi:MAG: DUF1858 domain-containing protein [Nanoarchaeota archaeon]|mgnify:CR=1 FL=1